IAWIEVKIVAAFTQFVRQCFLRNLHASLACRPDIFQIAVAAKMQSELAFVPEIAMSARSQIEERGLPAIETRVHRIDVLREQALEPRCWKLRQDGEALFRGGEISCDMRLRSVGEAIELHILE